MLTITPQALDVIRRVTRHPTMQPDGGVRIARRPDPSAQLEVRAVQRPGTRDSVVHRRGARLYVDSDAAERIDGGELDAVTDDGGRVQFIVSGVA